MSYCAFCVRALHCFSSGGNVSCFKAFARGTNTLRRKGFEDFFPMPLIYSKEISRENPAPKKKGGKTRNGTKKITCRTSLAPARSPMPCRFCMPSQALGRLEEVRRIGSRTHDCGHRNLILPSLLQGLQVTLHNDATFKARSGLGGEAQRV